MWNEVISETKIKIIPSPGTLRLDISLMKNKICILAFFFSENLLLSGVNLSGIVTLEKSYLASSLSPSYSC